MRFADTVRYGGKGALVIGLLSLSLVSGNSLGYYYGYSSASFGVQQSSDPFANQNVNYSPEVSMVSSQSQSQSYDYGTSSYSTAVASANTYSGGFGVLASTYGYSTPATAQATTTYTAQSTNTSTSGSWGAVSNSAATSTVTFSSWNAAAGASGMVATSGSSGQSASSSSSPSSFYTPFGSWNTVVSSTAPAPSVYDIVYSDYSSTSSFSSGGWSAVNMSVVPRVTSTITAPAVSTPTVNTPTTPIVPLSAPEPGTMLTMSAGLALLLLKFRRRSS